LQQESYILGTAKDDTQMPKIDVLDMGCTNARKKSAAPVKDLTKEIEKIYEAGGNNFTSAMKRLAILCAL